MQGEQGRVGGFGGLECEQVDRGGPFLPCLPLRRAVGRDVSTQGLTAGLVGAAAVWAPHLHQGSAHATLHMGTAEALTHCEGREAADTSAVDTLEQKPPEMQHWLLLGCPHPRPTSLDTLQG